MKTLGIPIYRSLRRAIISSDTLQKLSQGRAGLIHPIISFLPVLCRHFASNMLPSLPVAKRERAKSCSRVRTDGPLREKRGVIKNETAPEASLRRLELFQVIPLGFEPKTHSLEGCCSIQLSYGTKRTANIRNFQVFQTFFVTRGRLVRGTVQRR